MEGASGGECKATEGHGPIGRGNVPPTPPSPLPQPTLGSHDLGACSRQARLSGQLAQTSNKVRQPQGWLHGQLRVARKPQQEFGQGAAGMQQECPGWAKRLQEWPQAR